MFEAFPTPKQPHNFQRNVPIFRHPIRGRPTNPISGRTIMVARFKASTNAPSLGRPAPLTPTELWGRSLKSRFFDASEIPGSTHHPKDQQGPSKLAILRTHEDPTYTGSNPSIGGSKILRVVQSNVYPFQIWGRVNHFEFPMLLWKIGRNVLCYLAHNLTKVRQLQVRHVKGLHSSAPIISLSHCTVFREALHIKSPFFLDCSYMIGPIKVQDFCLPPEFFAFQRAPWQHRPETKAMKQMTGFSEGTGGLGWWLVVHLKEILARGGPRRIQLKSRAHNSTKERVGEITPVTIVCFRHFSAI